VKTSKIAKTEESSYIGAHVSLIIDIRDKAAVFALVDGALGLVAKGKVFTCQIPFLANQLRITPECVLVDVGMNCDAALAMCKSNGFTPFKGSSIKETKMIEGGGRPILMVNYDKPPFLFVRD